jgi:hypothetical protein
VKLETLIQQTSRSRRIDSEWSLAVGTTTSPSVTESLEDTARRAADLVCWSRQRDGVRSYEQVALRVRSTGSARSPRGTKVGVVKRSHLAL